VVYVLQIKDLRDFSNNKSRGKGPYVAEPKALSY
jgi:hypothetical protein